MFGGILSPSIFNNYVDDLICDLKNVAFKVLVYAEDLAVICKNKIELDLVIYRLNIWSELNEIAINKKKSGILIIDNYRNDMNEYQLYIFKITCK